MSELEDLETNPLLVTLQTKFESRYLWAQHGGLICVPHSFSIRGLTLKKEFIEAHTFQKSKFLKDNFITNATESHWSIVIDGNEISTSQGYPEPRTVKILGEEIGYGKVGQMFRILLIDGPLIGNRNMERFDEDLFYQRELVWDQSMYTAFLYKFKECSKILAQFNRDIEQFQTSYMALPGQMYDAIARLQKIYDNTSSKFLGSVTRPYCSEARFKDIVCQAISCYMMNILHDKVFSVISEDCAASERQFAQKREILRTQSELHAILPAHISCDFTESGRKFSVLMDSHRAPHDMLLALKSLLDNLTTEVNKPVGRSVFDLPPPPPPSLTSDDFIPLLASVILIYDGSNLTSNLFYMENFRFYQKSADCLSFSLVTLRAAYSFLMGLSLTKPRPKASFSAYFHKDEALDILPVPFDLLHEDYSNDCEPGFNTADNVSSDQLQKVSLLGAADNDSEVPTIDADASSKRWHDNMCREVDELQLQTNIAGRELRRATSQVMLPSQRSPKLQDSVERSNKRPTSTNSLTERSQSSYPELGEFLSALKEDDRPVVCGRQS